MSPRQYASLPQNSESDIMAECAAVLQRKRATLFFKRAADVSIAFILTLLLLPWLALLALVIVLDSRGGAFFRQERIGRFGRPFRILKFRTMIADNDGCALTRNDDDRVTRVGRRIRRLHLDELPQLWNVLRGDMSLIGPRPEVPRFVEHYSADQRAALLVRPGITCRSSIAFADENERYPEGVDPEAFYISDILPEKCAMNNRYVLTLSLCEDVKIAAATVLNTFGKKIEDNHEQNIDC